MYKSIFQSLRYGNIRKKISWAIFIVVLYLFGQSIPIFTVPLNQEVVKDIATRSLLDGLAMVSGARFSSMTLFSLGLGPWMTSMILWRAMTMFKVFGVHKLPPSVSNTARLLLCLLVALIQTWALVGNMDFSQLGLSYLISTRLITVLLLISGAFVVIWLGNLNAEKGVGGSSIIILSNMILALGTNIRNFIFPTVSNWQGEFFRGVIITILILILTMITIVLYRAEYRIPMKRINVSNSYTENTYIPIRLSPAGGMPFMYAMTLWTLPPIIIRLLLNIYPEQPFLVYWSQNTGFTTWLGAGTYVFILYILSVAFAYFNYDATEIAKNMRNNGDYIEFIRPGKDTQAFIQRKIHYLAQIGAIICCTLGGVPLLFSIGKEQSNVLTLLFGNIFIITSLMMTIKEEIGMLSIWRDYHGILEDD